MNYIEPLNDLSKKISDEIAELTKLPHVLIRQRTGATRLAHKKDGSYVLQNQFEEKYADWKYKDESSLDEVKYIWEDMETYEEALDKTVLSTDQKLQLCIDTMQTVIDNTSEIATMQLLSDILERIKND